MNPNILRLTAVVLLFGAIFLGWYGYKAGQPKAAVTTTVVEPITMPQIAAAQKIYAGQTVRAADLTEVMVPHFNVSGFRSVDQLLGKTANREIESGAILLESDFQQYGPAARQLLPGERAVAVKIDEVSGVGGYIRPGDHVDVLFFASDDSHARRSSLAHVVLSDLRVISFGESIQDDTPASAAPSSNVLAGNTTQTSSSSDSKQDAGIRSAVLAVAEKDATTLMLAANVGQLRLALRGKGVAEKQAGTFPAVAAVNAGHEYFFIKSDSLLSPDNARPQPGAISRLPAAPGAAKPAISRKPTSSQIIIHYGDSTKTVTVKDAK